MRTVTPDFVAAATAKVVYPAILVELDFDSGPIYAWTGRGTLQIGDKDYMGAGDVLKVDAGEETSSLDARGAVLQLACARDEDLSIALSEMYPGRPARILFALFDEEANLIPNPVRMFSGEMDVMSVNDDPQKPVLTLTAENDLLILNRTKERRYTQEDQQASYPGDQFFSFVSAMQDRSIVWG